MSGKPTDQGRVAKSTTNMTREEKLKKANVTKKEWYPLDVVSGRGAVIDNNEIDLIKQLSPKQGRLVDISCMINHDGNTQFDLHISIGTFTNKIIYTYTVEKGVNLIDEKINVDKGDIIEITLNSEQPVTIEQVYFSAILEIKK